MLDGEVQTVSGIDATRTILEFLREDLGRTGTKEGCAEGDCGACTVVVGDLAADSLRFRAVNACIAFVPSLDGRALITVENLRRPDGSLHPVQRAMVECHGSQCGFCTPGFVMSLFALYRSTPKATKPMIDSALAGNLCRCTGYRPIVEAAHRMYDDHQANTSDQASMPWLDERTLTARLQAIRRSQTLRLQCGERTYFAPRKLTELAALKLAIPSARILAGGTDIGLWVTKGHRDLPAIIDVTRVADLQHIVVTATRIEIGAAVTWTDALGPLVEQYPELEELIGRFASPPIRNAATIGGNIANGSPIGDSMPALIALDTSLVLRRGNATRDLALDAFYLGYQTTKLQPGEFIERVCIPLPAPNQHFRTYKVSKRFDQDISAVCGAYRVDLESGKVRAARIVYGGLAPTVKRAAACEAALVGEHWTADVVTAAMHALEQDYAPIDDMRASADYRRRVASNLLYRFFVETAGRTVHTRVLDYAK